MNEQEIMKNASKVKIYGDLDNVIVALLEYKSKNENVYVEFNGHKLYSLLDDIDSCYVKVTGKSRQEFKNEEEAWREEYRKREAEEKTKARNNIKGWVEQGKDFVYPQKMKDWEKCVKARVEDLYHGLDLVNAIQAMEALKQNDGDFATAKAIIDDANHSGASYGMVMNIIVNFSKYGPDFYEFMEPEYSTMPQNKAYLDKVRKENEAYEKENAGKKPSQPGEE